MDTNRYLFIQRVVSSILTLFFLSLSLFSVAAHCEEHKVYYDIYGISYGHSQYRSDKVFYGGSPSKRISFEWIFWVVRNDERVILVDTGCNDYQMIKKWHISNYISPLDRLRQLNISALDVDDVIITHAHWDHMGGLEPYKNARVWIQNKEYDSLLASVDVEHKNAKGMLWKDLRTLEEIKKEGRLNLVSEQREILDGITVVKDGTHTPGHQYVVVNTNYGPVIIAGDAAYMYKNIFQLIPIGGSIDYAKSLATIKEMRKQVSSPFFILPGHDPMIMDIFPVISKGIVWITSGISFEEFSENKKEQN